MTTPRERALATALVVPYEFQIILVMPKRTTSVASDFELDCRFST